MRSRPAVYLTGAQPCWWGARARARPHSASSSLCMAPRNVRDATARKREMHRLNQWLLDHEITGLITAKAEGDDRGSPGRQRFGFMQFMVDCSVILNHRVDMGVLQRNIRVQKYRGSSFNEDESPFVIGKDGFDIAMARTQGRGDAKIPTERISSGVKRLDTMVGGGYSRGASVLITGFPGTA